MRSAIRNDRILWITDIATHAAIAAESNDPRTLHRLVKSLAGYQQRPATALRNKDGTITSDDRETSLRWMEHFKELFDARTCVRAHEPSLDCVANDTNAHGSDDLDDAWPQLHHVGATIDSLPHFKATGPDGIPAELLQAGGLPLQRRLHKVIRTAVRTVDIPHAWKGGRLTTAWKRKGATDNCDNHRGLLMSDHSGKVLTSLIKDQLEPCYLATIPNAQSGGVKGRSTSFVCHTVRLFQDFCRVTHRSAFVLFLDLAKAFDFIVREFVMGRKTGDTRDIFTALTEL